MFRADFLKGDIALGAFFCGKLAAGGEAAALCRIYGICDLTLDYLELFAPALDTGNGYG